MRSMNPLYSVSMISSDKVKKRNSTTYTLERNSCSAQKRERLVTCRLSNDQYHNGEQNSSKFSYSDVGTWATGKRSPSEEITLIQAETSDEQSEAK